MIEEKVFKPIDVEGEKTLQAIAKADKLNGWMFETILPYCKGNILEVGSGIGNISQFFLRNGNDITLSDIRDNYCTQLEEKFKDFQNLQGIFNLDLVDELFDEKYKEHLNRYDTIFALNVVEHIFDDALTMKNIHKLLKKDGHVIILVPAYTFLYNRFDVELDHYRRYNSKSLEILISRNFKVVNSFYFNFAGIFGWFVSGRIFKFKTIPEDQVKTFNLLVPIFRIVDKFMFHKAGLSVISIGKKV